MKHLPNDLTTLVHDRAFDQQAHWLALIEDNPSWREFEQTAYQTTEGKTVYILRHGSGYKSLASPYYVRPDVVDLFKNDPDVMYRELRRLAKADCLPVMPNQAHPTSAHILALAYDNERLMEDGRPFYKKWEFRHYQTGRSYYHGIGYEMDGKFIIVQSDGKVFHTVELAHAKRQS